MPIQMSSEKNREVEEWTIRTLRKKKSGNDADLT